MTVSATTASLPATAPETGTPAAIGALAEHWAAQRAERLARRELDPHDFDALRDAGFLALVAPEASGGTWRSLRESSRGVLDVLRTLGRADPSLALVASMHPAVVGFWLLPDAGDPDWLLQRQAVLATAAAGEQWGTITSEPGTGGDIAKTTAIARPVTASAPLPGRAYLVTGDKHFGSGSGVVDWMMTTAVPEGEAEPAVFAVHVRDRPWDGSAGLRLQTEWDGVGMAATQSHAMRLDAVPAVRLALDVPLSEIAAAATPFATTLFTAVVVGVVDAAVEEARDRLRGRRETLRPYERVEWAHADREHWLSTQALEGAIRALEEDDPDVAAHAALRAKQSVAELAEGILLRLGRVLGGGTLSGRSPFAAWHEDVRALGFLRPPWGLAHDQLYETSWNPLGDLRRATT